jgi:type IV secretion system protein VirB6
MVMTMITSESFLSSTLNTVDAVINQFVSTAYQQLLHANTGVITLLFTLYVMLLGYQFLVHHHVHLHTIMKQLILMLCVYGLVMNWHLYHLFVYRIFTIEPENIANILVNAADGSFAGKSIAQALDGIFMAVLDTASALFSQVSFSASGLSFIVYALLVLVIGTLMCLFALLLFIYAKMMMAISLALGPIFILFILWEPTRGLFSAWLNKLITIALVPIVTSTILVLMLSVIQVTLPAIHQPIEQLQFYGLAPFLGLTLATTMILFQVLRICSALGGGITLASLSMGHEIGRQALQKSGVASASRGLMGWTRNQLRQNHHYSGRRQP